MASKCARRRPRHVSMQMPATNSTANFPGTHPCLRGPRNGNTEQQTPQRDQPTRSDAVTVTVCVTVSIISFPRARHRATTAAATIISHNAARPLPHAQTHSTLFYIIPLICLIRRRRRQPGLPARPQPAGQPEQPAEPTNQTAMCVYMHVKPPPPSRANIMQTIYP